MTGKGEQRARIGRGALLLALYLLLMAVGMILLWPVIRQISTAEGREAFRSWAVGLGPGGVAVMLGIQFAQIVVAFIPGEPVEILAGALYGTWGGLLLCLVGCVPASAAVFAVVRRLGMPLLRRLFGEKLDRYAFLRDSARIETAVFLLFLIPGTPKDMLTYMAGMSPIPIGRFLAISTVARIPSIVTGTMAGDALLRDWKLALGVLLFTGIVGLAGILLRSRITARIRSLKEKRAG